MALRDQSFLSSGLRAIATLCDLMKGACSVSAAKSIAATRPETEIKTARHDFSLRDHSVDQAYPVGVRNPRADLVTPNASPSPRSRTAILPSPLTGKPRDRTKGKGKLITAYITPPSVSKVTHHRCPLGLFDGSTARHSHPLVKQQFALLHRRPPSGHSVPPVRSTIEIITAAIIAAVDPR